MWMPPTWSAAPRQMMTNNSYPRHLHHHHPNPNQQLIMHSQHNNNTLPPMFIPAAPRQMMTNNSYPRHLHHHHPNPNQQLIMHSQHNNNTLPPMFIPAAPRQMMTNNSYPRHLHHHPNPNQQLIMHSQHNNNTLPPMFIPSETFQGARAGYVFRSSTQGTGYYLDVQFVQTTLDKKNNNTEDSKVTSRKRKKAMAEKQRRNIKHFRDIVGTHEKIEKNVEVVDMDKLLKFGPEHFKRASVCDLFVTAIQIMDFGMVRNPSKPGKRLEECYKGAVVKFDDGTLRAIPVEQFMLPGVPCMAKDGAHEGAEEMFAFRLTGPFELRQCNEKLCRIVVIIKWESDNKLCCKDLTQVRDVHSVICRDSLPVHRYSPGEADFSGTDTKSEKIKVGKQLVELYDSICELGKKRYCRHEYRLLEREAELVRPGYSLQNCMGQEERDILFNALLESRELIIGQKRLEFSYIKKCIYIAIHDLASFDCTGSSAHAIKKYIQEKLLPDHATKKWSDRVFKDALNDELLGINKPEFTSPNLRLGILLAIDDGPHSDGRSADAIKKYMQSELLFPSGSIWVDSVYKSVLEKIVENGEVMEKLERRPLDEIMARSDSYTETSGGMSTITVELSLTFDMIRGNIYGILPELDVVAGDFVNDDVGDRSQYLNLMMDVDQGISLNTCRKEKREKKGIRLYIDRVGLSIAYRGE
jgi:hypothetical protein